ncbi:MAG TPA: hemolysin family protein [Gemmatimonadaceae bacterium]|nr:hemolysin family protein [Gemmatimonadaceae bacterium]
MTFAWSLLAILSSAVAAILAATDGALLASAYDASRVTSDPERTHRALSLGRVLTHLVTGTALALALAHSAFIASVAFAVAMLLLLINVALVEGISRAAGYARGPQMVQRLAPVVTVVDFIMAPVTWMGGVVERALARVLPPADEKSIQRDAGAAQFREVVAAEADVGAAEEELLHGVFSLRDTAVDEIMVPRVDVVGIEKTTPWSEVLDRIRSSEHARFPVFEDSLDDVIGILYAKDLLRAVVAGAEPDDWPTLIRPASFIPGTKTIDQQLRDFRSQRTHIAIVIDEYGGTAGLVTIEDVLEEIVGEIRDEHDVEEPPIEQEGDAHFWVSGRLSLADLSEALGYDFQREDLTTVGGLLYDAFGRVPRAGESAAIGGFKVVVERVRRRRIERVYFDRQGTPAPERDA